MNFNLNDWLREGGSRKLRHFVLNKSYSRNSWVFACVRAIGNSIASVPLNFYDDAGNLIEDKEHPLLKVFRVPKAFDIPSLSILIRNTVMLMELQGGCHWTITKKNGKLENIQLRKLIQLRPMMKGSEILWWVLVDTNGFTPKKTYFLGDVITFKEFSPSSPLDAVPPLKPSRLDIEQDFSMAAWNASFFDKGAKKDIIIEVDRPMNKEQRKEFLKDLIANRQGVEAAHGYLLLTGGAKGKETNGVRELSFNNSRQFSREAICAAFGVPPAIVGIFRYANYANSREQRKIFWEQTLFPKMQFIQEQIQVQFLDQHFPGYTVDWDYKTIKSLKKDSTEQAQSAQIYYNMGYTREEIARILDAPELNPKPQNSKNFDNLDNLDVEDDDLIGKGTSKVTDFYSLKDSWWVDYARSVQNILATSERRWIRAYKAFCKLAKDAALKRAERLHTDLHVLEWASYWEEMSRGLVESDWELGGALVVEEERRALGSKLYTSEYLNYLASFKVLPLNVLLPPEEVESFYAAMNQVLSSVFKVGHNVVEDINSTLIPLLNQGVSMNDIYKSLTKWYEGAEQKALILARNISGSGYNTARYTMMNNRGVEKHKWVNSGDEHVRASHVLENTHEVKVGDKFPVTHCRYPHDPSGALKEIINCRCTTVGTVYKKRDRFVPVSDSTLPDVVGEEGVAAVKKRILSNPILKDLLQDIDIKDIKLDVLTEEQLSIFDEWLQRQQTRKVGLHTKEQLRIIKSKEPFEEMPGEIDIEDIKANLEMALEVSYSLVDDEFLKGLSAWEHTGGFGNFATGRFVKTYSEIGEVLNALNLSVEIDVEGYITSLEEKYSSQLKSLVGVDKVKQELNAGRLFRKNYKKRLADLKKNEDLWKGVKLRARDYGCKVGNPVRTILTEEDFFNAVPKKGDVVDLPYCSASHLGFEWSGRTHVVFDIPDDDDWWNKNVLFTKFHLNKDDYYFDSASENWIYHREEEIVLKNHWVVSKIKELKDTSERVYVLKPIKEEEVNAMLTKQGKSVAINAKRIHRPAMSLAAIEKEEKAKNKVREWCKQHWEQVKVDYDFNDVDSMILLTQMYPNYKKPE